VKVLGKCLFLTSYDLKGNTTKRLVNSSTPLHHKEACFELGLKCGVIQNNNPPLAGILIPNISLLRCLATGKDHQTQCDAYKLWIVM